MGEKERNINKRKKIKGRKNNKKKNRTKSDKNKRRKNNKKKNQNKREKTRKEKMQKKKNSNRKLTKTDANNDKSSRKVQTRKVFKGQHCDYIDLCGLKTKSASGCDKGMKFVVKGTRTNGKKVRRQFLNLDDKMIIAFLEQGKKIMDCTNGTNTLKDVTNQVTCKAIPKAAMIKLDEKQAATTSTPTP